MKILYLWLIPLCIPAAVYGIHKQNERATLRPLAQHHSSSKRVCEVHNVVLQPDVVSIGYGLIPADREDVFKAKQTVFPNSNLSVQGGCVVENYTRAQVNFCSQCRTAEQMWRANRAQQPR